MLSAAKCKGNVERELTVWCGCQTVAYSRLFRTRPVVRTEDRSSNAGGGWERPRPSLLSPREIHSPPHARTSAFRSLLLTEAQPLASALQIDQFPANVVLVMLSLLFALDRSSFAIAVADTSGGGQKRS